jgi:HEAT repeat protein
MALRLEDLLELLHDPAPRVRERAIRRLLRRGRLGFTPAEGLLVLKASSLPYPRRRDAADDTAVDLLRAALHIPYPEYLPAIVARFQHWHRRARREALNLLMRIDDPRAAEAVVEIVRQHGRTGGVPSLPLGQHARQPQHAEIFFPALLDFLSAPKLSFPIASLALSFATGHQIDPAMLQPHVPQLLALLRRRRDWLGPRQEIEGFAWMWEPSYHLRRWKAGVLLDLLGHVPSPPVEAELRRCLLEFTDPRLQMGAILSLLRQDAAVEPATVVEIAGSSECRKWLFDGLHKLERSHLFPRELRSQPSLAESDLVNWLLHPTELGRPPDEIEFVQVVPFDTETDAGWADCFLFRFRTHPPHWAARDGWMAGVSGPFLRKDQPTIQALGDTFSAFTPWDRKSVAEHVDDVRELIKSWRERHVVQEE